MKNEDITAWVTKYALTDGIQKVSGTVRHETSSDMLSYQARNGYHGWTALVHGKDWHRTPEAALARAEEMRKAKIASLKKSIAKLEVIKFSAESDV
jgi:hypothetical protein